ncbi:hypothetical protein ACEWY4_021792 [Coilia grayii]|uniref:CASP8-associated protein 2 n=1 Tax=Coilia grayii TaxID=363190 RepID=A0ABD1J4E0_9TELE
MQSESMDLFEEIIVEERLKKEASYNEMKTKFDEAQSQLQELIQKLQQLETQNSTLQAENTLLKKNLCSLIKTAKSEIGRKDAEINRLSERTGRGNFEQTYRRPQSNHHTNHASTGPSCKRSNCSPSISDPLCERGNCNVEVLAKHTPVTPVRTHLTPLSTTELPRTKDANVVGDNIANGHNSASAPLGSAHGRVPESQHLPIHRSLNPTVTASCSGDRGQNNTELQGDSAMAKSTTESVQNLSEKRPSRHSNMRHNPSASEKSTSSKSTDQPQKHRSPPSRHASSSQMSKGPVKDYSGDPLLERSRVCRETEGSTSGHRSHRNISSERSRVSSSHRREKSPARNYYKEEREKDRSKESTSKDSRSSRADKKREQELRTEKERLRSSREPTTSRSAKQKAIDRAPERKLDARENRAGVSAIKCDNSRDSSSHKKDQLRKIEGEERQAEVPVNTSRKTKAITMSEEHTLQPIDRQRYEGDIHHSNKEVVIECSSAKTTVDNGHVQMKVKSSEYGCANDREKKKDNAQQEKDFIPSEELVTDVRPVEENSPNRKLSFMETLNLTLSPIKKPNQCKKQNSESTEAGFSEGKSNLSDAGEEFYVIDEVEASVEESHVDEKMAVSAGASSKLQVNLECCNKTSTEEGETSVPAVTEVASSSQTDVLKAGDEKGNVGCILPTSEVAEKVTVATDETVTPVIPHEGPSHRTNSAYSDTAATTENNIATSFCTNKHTVSESCLDVEKCSAEPTAEPETHAFTETSKENGQENTLDRLETASFVCSDMLQDGPVSEMGSKNSTDKEMAPAESCVYLDSVSSTVNLETTPSCTSSCAATVEVLNVSNMETGSVADKAEELDSRGLSREQLNEVAKVSSTTKKDTVLQEEVVASSNETPPHRAKDCEPDSTENTEHSSEPSSSTVLPQDEDSMMLTLKTIKLIPDVISPLTSPVRQVKKVQPTSPGKQTHIKSLSTDFQNVTLEADSSRKAVDVNKENKKPDCSTPTPEDSPPGSSEQEELEEGEIVSESEADEAPVTAKRPKTHKEGKKPNAVKTHHSPQTRLIKMASKRNSKDVQPKVGHNSTRAVANSSPSSKRRFKTVPPPDPKTLPPSSTIVEEIMNMFKVIRSQLRKKYMKLNKNFPKKTFSSVIEMSNLSFTDLVSSLNLHKLCDQESVVKAKLKKIIINVMNKIGNNGIVNRIFEQNSHNLKSKLWSFVEGQLDFLFKEIQTSLASSSTLLDGKALSKRDHTENPDKTTKAKKKQEVSPFGTTAKRQVEEISIVKAKEGPVISTPCPLRRPAYQTGLGSRGKNLKMSVEETNEHPGTSRSSEEIPQTPSEGMVAERSEDRVNTFVRRLSHSGSTVDKSEFEILTEQQTSSLTFNLVSDSQMGDIFKSLLQGSDLLENSASLADNQSWLLGTPKKELSSERSLLTGMLTPTKFGTPSKLMAAWASISPCKFLSPNPKVQMPLNPAALDESCLLEIPSSPVPSRVPQPTSTSSLKTFSILAEDLAVSLTIPSPLKTDSRLSFLHPFNEEPVSTPEEILSAHFSEDAVLDGEDATEHDIHLSLDTDNSSCESSAAGHTWESTEPKVFQIKPHMPMQAVVTERSNDHFIVKIRHTSTVSAVVPAPETGQAAFLNVAEAPTNPSAVEDSVSSTGQNHPTTEEFPVTKSEFEGLQTEKAMLSDKSEDCGTPGSKSHVDLPVTPAVSSEVQQGEVDVAKCSSKDNVDVLQETINGQMKKRKKKKHHIEPKPKRAKTEAIADRHSKRKHRKKTKNNKNKQDALSARKKKSKASAPSPQLSPQSLSAKNVVRKRGEVVVTWTREEDRDILVELKMKGPSRNTFSALSEKLKKSPSQIAERFAQLMKLFKKKEKMGSP